MQPLILSVLLSLVTPGINAHQHRHAHQPRHAHQHRHEHAHRHENAHLDARDLATVIDVVTTVVTKYVYPDGSPVSETTSSSTSTTSLSSTSSTTTSTTSLETTSSNTSLEAIFLQLSTSSSTTSTAPAAPSTSSPVVGNTPEAVPEAEVLPSLSSTTPIAAPPSNPTPNSPAAAVTTQAPAAVSVAGERTFTIINSHTAAVSTAHDDTEGTPTSNGSPLQPGTIAVGATATFAVQPGWIGNIAINDASFPITSNSTLIEANFANWFGTPRADFDVSFVNGFTVPATCSCDGAVTTGCNLDLLSLMECPLGVVDNGCANPLRASEVATEATSFFAPCQGAAWTFVNDGNADSNCQDGPIECCIGAACPANPKQGTSA